mmetsp:Transcript_63626/g.186120  ORF Transcript_63626/g.186120 Transcript_63626/m.186120 type:complete len:114 (+) Transcript_63626:3-344(+)
MFPMINGNVTRRISGCSAFLSQKWQGWWDWPTSPPGEPRVLAYRTAWRGSSDGLRAAAARAEPLHSRAPCSRRAAVGTAAGASAEHRVRARPRQILLLREVLVLLLCKVLLSE